MNEPDYTAIPHETRRHAWKVWGIESVAFSVTGPLIHFFIACRGRSDIEELAGVLIWPLLGVVVGLYLCGRRRDRLGELCADQTLHYRLRNYGAMSGVALIILGIYQAGCVILWSAILYNSAPASTIARYCAAAWLAFVATSASANGYYISSFEKAIQSIRGDDA